MRSPAEIDETNDGLPIVILGGGFGGLFAALHLRDLHSGPIILIDQSWNFVFKPLLYELLSSEVKLELICPRYDALLHKSDITFVLGAVEAIACASCVSPALLPTPYSRPNGAWSTGQNGLLRKF